MGVHRFRRVREAAGRSQVRPTSTGHNSTTANNSNVVQGVFGSVPSVPSQVEVAKAA